MQPGHLIPLMPLFIAVLAEMSVTGARNGSAVGGWTQSALLEGATEEGGKCKMALGAADAGNCFLLCQEPAQSWVRSKQDSLPLYNSLPQLSMGRELMDGRNTQVFYLACSHPWGLQNLAQFGHKQSV